ncbi:unnamed protein product [Caenorhabditis brenneri]
MNYFLLFAIFSVTLTQTTALDAFTVGDGRNIPSITVSASFENDILTVKTHWLIIRECDRFSRSIVSTSSKGQFIESKSSCIHGRVCGFGIRGGPPAEVPITCDVFAKNI